MPDVDANGIRLHYDVRGEGEPLVLIMGVATGTFGGLMRDVVANEIPMVLRQGELYVSACLAGALGVVISTGLSTRPHVTRTRARIGSLSSTASAA